jgi:hypothetical protein
VGGIGRRIMVQGRPRKKCPERTYQKNNYNKDKVWAVTQKRAGV